MADNKDKKISDKEIIVPATTYSPSNNADITVLKAFESKENVLQWKGQGGEVSWNVDIPEDGLFNVKLDYSTIDGQFQDIQFAFLVDGKIPFESASALMLFRPWREAGSIVQDMRGNDLTPVMEEFHLWQECYLKDKDGKYNDPFLFYLTKGRHTLTIKAEYSDFVLDYIKLMGSKPLPKYEEAKANLPTNDSNMVKGVMTKVQAELPYMVSDYYLKPLSDRNDPATEPGSASCIKLNTIGSDYWSIPGQYIKWKFNVEKDGLYNIGLRARQNINNGLYSNRRVYIDGKVPYKELNAVKFPFDLNWRVTVFGDKEPFLFYLTKGTHEITMEAVTGDMADSLAVLGSDIFQLNEIYRKIFMITGSTPDKYRDYYLEDDIPGLLNDIARVNNSLREEKAKIEKANGGAGSESAKIQTLIMQLDSFLKKPETIALRIDSFKSNISALSAWVENLSFQPLEVDYLFVKSPDMGTPKVGANIFQSLVYQIQSLFASFNKNYGMVGNSSDDSKALNVWIAMGRDQLQSLKRIIDESFTSKTGIKVNVNLVAQGLSEAIVAGKGPDVALLIDNATVNNLAMRGALTDVSKLDGYRDVEKRFMPSAMVSYQFNGAIYAVPATQTFSMLYYRKDVFKELGVEVPKTWDELYSICSKLQSKHLDIGITNDTGVQLGATSASTGQVDQGLFTSLVYQNGGQLYNDARTKTMLDDEPAIKAFSQWTQYFTKYSFPLVYDFFNRFRTGEMPLGISNYETYNIFQQFMPEMKGLWEMTKLPGTVRPDGTIDYSDVSGGAGCIIPAKSGKKNEAWQFVKWFTEAQSQVDFGRSVEAIQGPAGRYSTANIEAFKQLPWSNDTSKIILDQWKDVKGIPPVPGDYYVSRNVSNAFRKVVYPDASNNAYTDNNPRHVLHMYNIEMNKEIERKRMEFGLDKAN